jgi:protein-disulfide isomerase
VIKEDAGKAAIVRRAVAGCAIILLITLAACSKSSSKEEAAKYSSNPETAKIERIVHAYIVEHPEVIEEAFEQRESRAMAKLVDANRKDIEAPFAGAWAGARDGDVTLVEFFDYACPFCKATNGDVTRLLDEDKNLKVVWRELPVLGPNSHSAALVSMAAAKQGQFRKFHDTLFAGGRPDPETIAKAQAAVGVKAMQSPEFEQELDKNNDLARKLGAQGTPTFVVGDKILNGAVGYAALKDAIDEARRKKA